MSLRPILSKSNRSLLLPYEGQIRQLWPNARLLEHNGTRWALVSDDPAEHVKLKAAGLDLPAPILRYYHWENASPSPFQTQRLTAAGCSHNQRFYCLNDMGTGKTRSSLWAWRYLNRAGCAGRLLVVAPLSTLKFTWLTECFAIMPDVKAVVLHGTKKKRLELLKSDADVFVINHDGLRTIIDALAERRDIDCLILDELAVYRNNSQRSKTMRKFAQRFSWCWGLTGRPMPNAPTDVWGQCKILTPWSVPKFFTNARSMLMEQLDMYTWAPKKGATEIALQWMQPSIRIALDDGVQLPTQIHRTIDVDLTEEQSDAYHQLVQEMMADLANWQITSANAGVGFFQLLQVASGFVYTQHPAFVELDATPRKQMLVELIDEAPHKVLVFAPWRHLISGLSTVLTENEIDHAVIHGDIKKRDEIFAAFQNTEQYRVLLCHPGTVHHGLPLTAATTAIWFSPVPSLEIYEQACARIRRVGQQHKQQFLHLQGCKVERRVYGMLRSKQRLQDQFLAMMKEGIEK